MSLLYFYKVNNSYSIYIFYIFKTLIYMNYKEIITSKHNYDIDKTRTEIMLEDWTSIIFEDNNYDIYATDQTTWKKYKIIKFIKNSEIVYYKKIFGVRLEGKITAVIDEYGDIIVITDWDKKFYPNDFDYHWCYIHDIFWHEFWPAHIYWFFQINNTAETIDSNISTRNIIESGYVLINENFIPLKTKDGEIITWVCNIECPNNHNHIVLDNETYILISALDKDKLTEQKIIFKHLYINKNFETLKADNIYKVKDVNNESIKLFNKTLFKVTVYITSKTESDCYIAPNGEFLKTNKNDIIWKILGKRNFGDKTIYQIKTIASEEKFIDENLNIVELEVK